MVNDLEKIKRIIDKVDRNKSKMTADQFEQIMVYLKGLHARSLKPPKPKRKKGEFEVGDRVRAIKSPCVIANGEEGTVCKLDDDGAVGVEWDKAGVGRHNCQGAAKRKHGRWMEIEEVELI